jgi:hypothetical protein
MVDLLENFTELASPDGFVAVRDDEVGELASVSDQIDRPGDGIRTFQDCEIIVLALFMPALEAVFRPGLGRASVGLHGNRNLAEQLVPVVQDSSPY